MSDSVRLYGQQPIRLPCPRDSPGKNTRVGCHFLLLMYFAYRLNKQGDNIQPWHTPFPIWNQSCSMSSSNCCFLTCIQVSQEAGQIVWYSHLFQNFPQSIVIHMVKGFGIVNIVPIALWYLLCNFSSHLYWSYPFTFLYCSVFFISLITKNACLFFSISRWQKTSAI